MRGSKSSDNHIIRNPPWHLICIVFWLDIAPNGSERPMFSPKWPKIHILGKLDFRPWSTKVVGIHIDIGPGPGRNYGETAVFTFCRKAENWQKIRFLKKKHPKSTKKKHPKSAKRLIFFWENGSFFFGPNSNIKFIVHEFNTLSCQNQPAFNVLKQSWAEIGSAWGWGIKDAMRLIKFLSWGWPLGSP